MGNTASESTVSRKSTFANHQEQSTDSDSESDLGEVEEWVRSSDPAAGIRLMVTGKTGAGKSTLLNGLVGAELFPEGDDLEPETLEVHFKSVTKDDIKVVAYDTPGLQDGFGNEQKYLLAIRRKCRGIHVLLYCFSMLENRLNIHNSAIQVITEALGINIWKNAVIVLTFANIFEEGLNEKYNGNIRLIKTSFREKVEEYKKFVQEYLQASGVSSEIYKSICVVPAGIGTKPHLLTQQYWLSNFWLEALLAMKEEAQVAMIKMSLSRMQYEDDIKPEDFDRSIADQPIVVKKLEKGVAAGAATVGFAAGATTGALIGGLAFGFVSFGVAAGAGLVLGGVVGGGIGAGGGAGIGLLVALHRRNKKRKKMEKLKKEAFEILSDKLAN